MVPDHLNGRMNESANGFFTLQPVKEVYEVGLNS